MIIEGTRFLMLKISVFSGVVGVSSFLGEEEEASGVFGEEVSGTGSFSFSGEAKKMVMRAGSSTFVVRAMVTLREGL